MQTTNCQMNIEGNSNAVPGNSHPALANLLSRARIYEASRHHSIASALRQEASRLEGVITAQRLSVVKSSPNPGNSYWTESGH